MFSHDKPPEFTFLLLAGNNRKEYSKPLKEVYFLKRKLTKRETLKKKKLNIYNIVTRVTMFITKK